MSGNYQHIIIKGGIVKAHYLIRFNQDMGFSVNPEGSKLQMEGCVTMGLGCALSEEIR